MSCCKGGASLPSEPSGACLGFLIILEGFKHECGWDPILSGPAMGTKCSCQLTLVKSSTSDLSPLESVLCLLVALERGSVETEGALPIDHTPTIKLVRAYKTREDLISV